MNVRGSGQDRISPTTTTSSPPFSAGSESLAQLVRENLKRGYLNPEVREKIEKIKDNRKPSLLGRIGERFVNLVKHGRFQTLNQLAVKILKCEGSGAHSTSTTSTAAEPYPVVKDGNINHVVFNHTMTKNNSTVNVEGRTYGQVLTDEQRTHGNLRSCANYTDRDQNTARARCKKNCNLETDRFVPEVPEDEFAVITTDDPKKNGGKYKKQAYNIGTNPAELEAAARKACNGKTPDGVVAVLVKKGADGEQVLIHKHDEDKNDWGYDQHFWGMAGGKVEGGILNTALTELYEESGFQLPSKMRLARVVHKETKNEKTEKTNTVAYVIFEDLSNDVKEQSKPSPPAPNQYYGFRYTSGSRTFLLPRQRGDNDAAEVRWARINRHQADGQPFVEHKDVPENMKEGRFNGFANNTLKEHICSVLDESTKR